MAPRNRRRLLAESRTLMRWSQLPSHPWPLLRESGSPASVTRSSFIPIARPSHQAARSEPHPNRARLLTPTLLSLKTDRLSRPRQRAGSPVTPRSFLWTIRRQRGRPGAKPARSRRRPAERSAPATVAAGSPAAESRRFVDAHHIHHWAHGGETKLDNRVQLCGHHHRLVHEGGFVVEPVTGGRVRFRRPDGTVVRVVPHGPRSEAESLTRVNNGRGLAIDAATLSPGSCETLAVSDAVDALVVRAPPG